MAIKGLTEGRIVHYVLPLPMPAGESQPHRPAIVTNVNDRETGDVNLLVFFDVTDYTEGVSTRHRTVRYDEDTKDGGTWHFPEYVE